MDVDGLNKLRRVAIKAVALISNELRLMGLFPRLAVLADRPWSQIDRIRLAGMRSMILEEIGEIDAEVDRLMKTTPSRGVLATSPLPTKASGPIDAFVGSGAFEGDGWRN